MHLTRLSVKADGLLCFAIIQYSEFLKILVPIFKISDIIE